MKSFHSAVGLCVLVLLLASGSSLWAGIVNYWDLAPPDSGDWFVPTNWLTPIVPGDEDTAYINNAGTAVVSAGDAAVEELHVGSSATGNLEISGGEVTVGSGGMTVGSGAGSNGSVTQSDGGLVFKPGSDALEIGEGDGATGSYELTGGTLDGSSLRSPFGGIGVGCNGGTGTFTQGGGIFLGAFLNIGHDGTGTFTLNGGTVTLTYLLNVASVWPLTSNGTFTQTGGSLSCARDVYVGYGKPGTTGQYTVSGGTQTIGKDMVAGELATFDIKGDGQVTIEDELLLYGGEFHLSESASLSSMTLSVEDAPDSPPGHFYQSGGVYTVTETATVTGGGDYAQSGGTSDFGALNVEVGGRYDFTGGTLKIAGNWSTSGVFDFVGSSASVTAGPNVLVDFSAVQPANAQNGAISVLGNESFVIFPAGFDPELEIGTFTNEGTTYTVGSTLIVRDGRTIDLAGQFDDPLHVEGTVRIGGGLAATGGVNVAETGTGALRIQGSSLQGRGTIGTNVEGTGGAVVSPGSSPGILTIVGDYDQSGDSTLLVELGGLAQGAEYDFLDVSGTARLAGTLEVDLIDLGMGPFTPSMGDTFDVLGAASIHLDGLLLDGDSSFTAQVISDGPRETLRLTAVPEPSAFVLLAVGGVLLAGYGLRRFCHVAA